MNGLDVIIRDNLRAQARAFVAAMERGDRARAAAILSAAPDIDPDNPDYWTWKHETTRAYRERAVARGL